MSHAHMAREIETFLNASRNFEAEGIYLGGVDKIANDSNSLVMDPRIFCTQHVDEGGESIALDYLILVLLIFECQGSESTGCCSLDLPCLRLVRAIGRMTASSVISVQEQVDNFCAFHTFALSKCRGPCRTLGTAPKGNESMYKAILLKMRPGIDLSRSINLF